MSWTQVDTRPEHRRELAGFEVVGILRGVIPVVVEKVTVRYLEKQPWNLLQEFTARAVADVGGFRGAQQVAEALGLKREAFIAPILEDFMAQGLVVRGQDGQLRPTPRFAEVVRERCIARPVGKTVNTILEPVSNSRRLLEQGENRRLTSCVTRSKAALSSEHEFALWVGSPAGPLAGQHVESCRFDERNCNQGLECDVVAYVDANRSQWGWEVIDPQTGKPSQELRAACDVLGVEDAVEGLLRQQTGANEGPAQDVESKLSARVAELEAQIAQSSKQPQRERLERLLTHESRKRLKDLIRNAKSEVVLRFPWIKAAATADLLPDLQLAVRRGACVLVGYGICESEEQEESEGRAIESIESLRSNSGDNVATVVWLGNSHAKEAVIDRRHYLGGSFNVLSFRGDPDRRSGQIRQEVMVYTDSSEFVGKAARALRDEFRARLARRALSRDRSKVADLSGWCARWQGAALLGMSAAVMRAALAEFPVKEARFDRACVLIARGLSIGPEFERADEERSLLTNWTAARCESSSAHSSQVRGQIADELAEMTRAMGERMGPVAAQWATAIAHLRA